MKTGGIVNTVLTAMGLPTVKFLTSESAFRHLYVWSSVWSSAGWGSIIYMAALSGVDPQQYEAATLDGATRHTIFWKIILPNAKPIVANTAINAFIAPWVDFIFVSVIMKDNYNNYTVAKGLYTMVDKANIYEYYTVFCAGAVVVAVPIVLLFIRLQKYYVAGVAAGASKG